MSNRLLTVMSIVSFVGAVAIVWTFDSKLALFLAILLATVGGVTPLAVMTRRKNDDA